MEKGLVEEKLLSPFTFLIINIKWCYEQRSNLCINVHSSFYHKSPMLKGCRKWFVGHQYFVELFLLRQSVTQISYYLKRKMQVNVHGRVQRTKNIYRHKGLNHYERSNHHVYMTTCLLFFYISSFFIFWLWHKDCKSIR